jgi:hypothetical protein
MNPVLASSQVSAARQPQSKVSSWFLRPRSSGALGRRCAGAGFQDPGNTEPVRFGFGVAGRQCHLPPLRCLTLRSSGPPPAWHLGREASQVIVRLAAQAPTRRGPLSSNVRPHRHPARSLRPLPQNLAAIQREHKWCSSQGPRSGLLHAVQPSAPWRFWPWHFTAVPPSKPTVLVRLGSARSARESTTRKNAIVAWPVRVPRTKTTSARLRLREVGSSSPLRCPKLNGRWAGAQRREA